MNKLILLSIVLSLITPLAPAAEQENGLPDLPKAKQTSPGLHVTAKEAYEKWKADPEGVKVLDVRTPEEYIFVGHPAMATNIPLMFIRHKWNAEKKAPVMAPNPEFLQQVKRSLKTTDTILVLCRSGGRSAKAVALMAEAGFKKAYAITHGFEGDKVKDPASPSVGKRTLNGWKSCGAPWTYSLRPELMYLPGRQE